MPLVLLLTAFLFYLTFYLYNRCILPQDAYILSFRGSALCGEENGRVRSYIEQDSKKQIGTKYIGLGRIERDIRVNAGTIEVKLLGNQQIFGKSQLFAAAKQARRICPVKEIRKIRLMKKLGEKIQPAEG